MRSAGWDEAAWAAFARELRAWRDAGRVATFWWRDDDAGRPDPGFERLLALAATTGQPLGLAVVPAWLTPEVAAALHEVPPRVTVLQHGWAHANHEPASAPPGAGKPKPAECGAARPAAAVLAEASAGWARLTAAVGARALPVFVPPWNRIAPAVRDGLTAAGYRALSTFGPRDPRDVSGLRQLNCHADPVVWREGKRFAGCAATLERLRDHLAARREGRVDPTEPTGLLTHHRDMAADFWGFLEEWLTRLRDHPAVRFPPIPALIS
jgi:hypothetical protein